MKEDEIIKTFVNSKDYCFRALSRRYGPKAALKKLIIMNTQQSVLYGREFNFHFNYYRNTYKQILQIVSRAMQNRIN